MHKDLLIYGCLALSAVSRGIRGKPIFILVSPGAKFLVFSKKLKQLLPSVVTVVHATENVKLSVVVVIKILVFTANSCRPLDLFVFCVCVCMLTLKFDL